MAFVRLSYYICVVVVFSSLSVHVFSGVVNEGTPGPYEFNYIPRDAWTIVPATDSLPAKLPVPYVVVHHTYIPKACFTVTECVQAMGSMQNYHNNLHWGDIGYNFCIGAEGTAFEGRGWDLTGIHAGPANNHSIGICMIGDWREELPPKIALNTLKALIKKGVKMGKIREDYKLIGHQQAMNTECPGTALMAEISTWEHFEAGRPNFRHLKTINTPERLVLEKFRT